MHQPNCVFYGLPFSVPPVAASRFILGGEKRPAARGLSAQLRDVGENTAARRGDYFQMMTRREGKEEEGGGGGGGGGGA